MWTILRQDPGRNPPRVPSCVTDSETTPSVSPRTRQWERAAILTPHSYTLSQCVAATFPNVSSHKLRTRKDFPLSEVQFQLLRTHLSLQCRWFIMKLLKTHTPFSPQGPFLLPTLCVFGPDSSVWSHFPLRVLSYCLVWELVSKQNQLRELEPSVSACRTHVEAICH